MKQEIAVLIVEDNQDDYYLLKEALVSSDEVTDLLLDVRALLSSPPRQLETVE